MAQTENGLLLFQTDTQRTSRQANAEAGDPDEPGAQAIETVELEEGQSWQHTLLI